VEEPSDTKIAASQATGTKVTGSQQGSQTSHSHSQVTINALLCVTFPIYYRLLQ